MREIGARSSSHLGRTIIDKLATGFKIVGSEGVGNTIWESSLERVAQKDGTMLKNFANNIPHTLKSLGLASALGGVFHLMGHAIQQIGLKIYPHKKKKHSIIKKLIEQHPVSSTLATSILIISACHTIAQRKEASQ